MKIKGVQRLRFCLSVCAALVLALSSFGSISAQESAAPEGYHDYDGGDVPSYACNAGGWAMDPDRPGQDVNVHILVDGDPVLEVLAENYREDLEIAWNEGTGGCPGGTCAFEESLWNILTPYEAHEIAAEAWDAETGAWYPLNATPKSLTCRTYDIYTYDTRTGETGQITALADSHEYNPRWSPDGRRIVHDRWALDWSENFGVHITDVATGASEPLAGAENGNYPTWSPNGQWIAFNEANSLLYIVPPSGGEPTLLRDDAFMASWAPNSRRLAFHEPSTGAILTMDLNGRNVVKVVDHGNSPAWSPDGEWIAFEVNDGELWKVGVDVRGVPLGEPIQLTSGLAWRPSWSADGKTIAFHAGTNGEDTDIWTIPAVGGTATRLTGGPDFDDYDPNYSNNGRYVAYSGYMPLSPPSLGLRVNYGHDWVESFYPAGHKVWLKVTESDGKTVKATATLVTEPKDFWGGETGFQTQPEDWDPIPPDIQPYDWVFGRVDNGVTAQVQIGDVGGMIDLEADSIQGTIDASWFSEEVNVECFPWGAPEPQPEMKYDSVFPDGIDMYSCSWDHETEWDIQFYQDVGVGYFGPDGHWVANAFFVKNPHFTVFPEWEWFDGMEWPDGASVSISVTGKPECITVAESWGGFFNGGFPEGCDVAVDDVVTFDDGTTIREHIVRSLAITDVDKIENTVAGTADPGAVVDVWVHEIGGDLQPTAGEDGSWLADFDDSGIDLVESMGGRAQIYDEMGNGTAVDWYIPNPVFTAFPAQDAVEGWEWPLGATVHLTIDDPATPESPDYERDEMVVWTPWDPNQTWVWFDIAGWYDMKPGDLVTVTDGMTTRGHTVRNLTITTADADADIVAGTADPGAEVFVWPHATGEQILATADDVGNWQADFSGVFDLVPGECGRSQVYDEMGNGTAVDWCVPNTRFTVWPQWNYLEGYEWPDGALVAVSVADKDACYTGATAGYPEWDPGNTFFSLSFPEGCAIEPGDEITVSSDTLSLMHVVQSLAVTAVNVEADTVAGTAVFDPELYMLHTWIHDVEGSYMQLSAPDGTWLADFGLQGFDLQPGMGGRVELVDQSSNATAAEWWIPNPVFTAFPEQEVVEGWEWPLGEVVHLAIDDPGTPASPDYQQDETVTVTPWGSGQLWVWFDFLVWYDLKAGDLVTLTDGVTPREHTVRNLTVTTVDAETNIVAGTADALAEVFVWLHESGVQILATADDVGNWQADFTGVFDLVPDECGRAEIRDEEGNSTAVDWCVPSPP